MNALKAFGALVVSAIAALVMILGPGDGLGDVSLLGWLLVAAAVLASSGMTWYVTNAPGAMYAKAVVAGATGGISALIVALDDNMITSAEALTATSAALVAAGVVWRVPNADPLASPGR